MLIKLYKLIILTAVLGLCYGCSDSIDMPSVPEPDSPGSITISFNNSNMTRSDDSNKSEVLIDNLTIALCPIGAEETAIPVAWASYEYLEAYTTKQVTMQLSDAMATALFNNTDGAKCRIFALANLPEGVTIEPFTPIATMKAMVFDSPFDEGTGLQTSFIMTGDNNEITYSAPASQAQKGKAAGTVALTRAAAKIILNVAVPTEIEVTDENGNVVETWEPQLNENSLNVSLINGVNKATAVPADKPLTDDEDDPYYYNSNLRSLKSGVGTNESYPYSLEVPFYTYPNYWTESAEETRKTTMTLIVPWHKKGDTAGSFTSFYYQVPIIPAEKSFLQSNYAYTVNLTVGMLGSLVPDTPVTVRDVSYQIVNWSEWGVDVPIDDYRYLVVNPNEYTFNNETNMAIPYYTSHPVELTDITIEYERFNFVSDESNPDIGRVVTFTINEAKINATNEKYPDQNIFSYNLSNVAGQTYLNIYHPLNLWNAYGVFNGVEKEILLYGHNKTYSDLAALNQEAQIVNDSIAYYKPIEEPAFSKYKITCTLRHIDKPEYNEQITIYQYPAIYIEADRNPATEAQGNIFVNGFSNVSGAYNYYGAFTQQVNNQGICYGDTRGLRTGLNKNPNMYIINITSLSEDITFTVKDEATEAEETYNYVIGDPRSKFCTNQFNTNYRIGTGWSNQNTGPSNQGAAQAPYCRVSDALYGGPQRRLTYYYITLEDGTVKNMIAPRIRVASSWGVTGGIDRVCARYRCALYQENAYPAGRWRIPTLAEFCYINKLSNENKIPHLYTPDAYYWTSEGVYKGTSDGQILRRANQNTTRYVRAVYDEWYWSEYPQYQISPDADGKFTYWLGDVPRGAQ